MARVLFAYEFGAGLGHLNRLLAAAKRLLEGNELVFALPQIELGSVVRRALGPGVKIRTGLFWSPPRDPKARAAPTRTFADVMQLFGYHQVRDLERVAQNWRQVLAEIEPRVIVSDFAPTLRLASRTQIPTVVLGNGYTVPPAGKLLPPMRPWDLAVPPESRIHEFLLLAAVNRVCATFKRPRVDFFSDLFQGERTFVSTLAEFDPYGEARSDVPLWPFNVPDIPEANESLRRRGPAVFCYMQKDHPALDVLLDALTALDCQSAIYVGGVDPARVAQKCGTNVHVYEAPADFRSVLPRTSVLIHHGGLGTAYAGLMAGVPQIILPVNLEHSITARGLDQFKVAVRVPTTPPPPAQALRGLIEATLRDSGRREASMRAASELRTRRDSRSLDVIVAACREYL